MVDSQLRPQGVNDPLVIAAMAEVPRERFVPESAQAIAYVDRSVPIGQGRQLCAPAVLGQLLTQMAVRPGERALVVGCGTGYSAAVLEAMGAKVVALECSADLAEAARGHGIQVVEGPLEEGHSELAPYDLVLVDGGVEFLPEALIAQLAEGGRLGAALVDRGVSRLVVGRKAAGGFASQSIADAGVPSLPGFSRPRAFSF